jgi:hypothetical protein
VTRPQSRHRLFVADGVGFTSGHRGEPTRTNPSASARWHSCRVGSPTLAIRRARTLFVSSSLILPSISIPFLRGTHRNVESSEADYCQRTCKYPRISDSVIPHVREGNEDDEKYQRQFESNPEQFKLRHRPITSIT